MTSDHATEGRGLSRRALLGSGALITGTALGGAVAGHAMAAYGATPASTQATTGAETVPFYGEHQAGILTPHQAHGVFLGLNLVRGQTKDGVIRLLQLLTDDAARLTQGSPPLGGLEGELASLPARLTVTFGFGPRLFDVVGLPDRCPPQIRTVPSFATDQLDKKWGQTDLLVQVCSDDPLVLTYVERRLLRDCESLATPLWVQRGFITARGTERDGTTARNLMGMRDGSANEREPEQQAAVVWSHPTTPALAWFDGGSQLILRRIRIDMRRWDDLETSAKELAFGRRVSDGSPLTGTKETDVVDRLAKDARGFPVIAPNAHAGLAQARVASERMFRRPFNYVDVPLPDGKLDEGLIFAAYQADLAAAFSTVQKRLAPIDSLNTWITHVGSAAYAIPPGTKEGSFVGAGLFA